MSKLGNVHTLTLRALPQEVDKRVYWRRLREGIRRAYSDVD